MIEKEISSVANSNNPESKDIIKLSSLLSRIGNKPTREYIRKIISKTNSEELEKMLEHFRNQESTTQEFAVLNEMKQRSLVNYERIIEVEFKQGLEKLKKQYNSNDYQPTFTMEDGSTIVRPLTIRESLELIVNNYATQYKIDGTKRTSTERTAPVFEMTTCTGIFYTHNSKRFKIIPKCEEIICKDLSKPDYEIIGLGNYKINEEKDISFTRKGNTQISLEEAKRDPFLLEVVEGEKELLSEYLELRMKRLKLRKNQPAYFSIRYIDINLSGGLMPLCIGGNWDNSLIFIPPIDYIIHGGRFMYIANATKKKWCEK